MATLHTACPRFEAEAYVVWVVCSHLGLFFLFSVVFKVTELNVLGDLFF